MIAKCYNTQRGLALAMTLLAGLTLITMTNSCRQQKQAYPGPRPAWTMDVKHAHITYPPHGHVTGEINGKDFAYRRAVLHDGNIRFMSARSDEYFLIRGLGTNISNNSFEVDTNSSDPPEIDISWREHGKPHTETFTDGYAMELQFEPEEGQIFPGRIYLCLPDDSKSYIAGTFMAALPRPKPAPQAPKQTQ